MRRDHFTLTAANTDTESDAEPTLVVRYNGPVGTLTARLEGDRGKIPSGTDIDAAFRLQGPLDDEDSSGVFSLTRRLTGEYLLEVDADATDIVSLVDAASDTDDEYTIRLERRGAEDISFEMETLLVYDEDGELRQQDSLIPGGVEL